MFLDEFTIFYSSLFSIARVKKDANKIVFAKKIA